MDRDDRLRDVVVVGSGPAGMGALLTGVSEWAAGRLNRVVLEASSVSGGQARMASRIEGLPGSLMGVMGVDLAEETFENAQRLGAHCEFNARVSRLETTRRWATSSWVSRTAGPSLPVRW